MKKVIGVGCVLILLCTFSFYGCQAMESTSKKSENPYQSMTHIKDEDALKQSENYYVYYYQSNCPYCKNIEEDIIEFSSKEAVYAVNLDEHPDRPLYNWDNHKEKYRIEIGTIDAEGNADLYNGYDEAKITEFFKSFTTHRVDYSEEKINNKIYAVAKTPIIDYSDISNGIIIPGSPMLLEIDNGNIINYYFDDYEIIDKLDIDKTPLDEQ